MLMPMDARLGGTAPALVARLGFILGALLLLATDHEVSSLQQRCDSHRKQPVEIHLAERIVGTDRGLLLQHDGTFIESVSGPEDRQSRVRIAAYDRPVD